MRGRRIKCRRSNGVRRIDARGGTIVPGLVEAHFHPTYFNVAELVNLDIKYPVEYVDISILEDRQRFIAVLQNGVIKAGQLYWQQREKK